MNPEKLTRTLWIISGVLVALHILNRVMGAPSWQFERLFDLSREMNVPTWFSSVQWLIAAWVAYGCAQVPQRPSESRIWFVLAGGFLILSIDEVAMIHENLGRMIEQNLYPQKLVATFSATNWPIAVMPFLALTLFWAARGLRGAFKGSAQARKLLILGAGLVIFGAMILEMLNNIPGENMKWLPTIETIVEESLEMAGVTTIIAGLFAHRKFLESHLVKAVRL